MKIALIGCGAMGSLYGGYLSKVHEVTVCDVSAALIDAINANGIIMDEPNGETVVFKPACATTDSSTVGVQDLVITFVNYKFLESALNTAKGMIGPNTIVMSLQNGMGNYDEIAKVVPEEQICCGTTAHGCTALEPGHVRHTGVGITAMGTIKGNPADAERVAEAMREAGFEVVVKENVLEVIWHKLFANIAINAITAILEQPNAYYPQPCCPSPYHAFPATLGLELEIGGDDEAALKQIANKLAEYDAVGRYSTWATPVAMSIIELGVDYAKGYIDGEITERNDSAALSGLLEEKVPGAVVATYTDANGTNFDNYYTILLAPVDFNDYL